MGCDIHMYVEKRELDKWIPVRGENPMLNFYKASYESAINNAQRSFYLRRIETCEPCLEWIYDGRSYALFSLLADVRNGFEDWKGLPRCGHYIEPIAMPRGLPDDVSKEVAEESDAWGIDGHSHSWFTLTELQNYIPNKNIKYRGLVTKEEFEMFLNEGTPRAWSSWSNAELISNEEMRLWLTGDLDFSDRRFVQTVIEWEEPINYTGLNGIIQKLQEITIFSDDVRIVFWFDN